MAVMENVGFLHLHHHHPSSLSSHTHTASFHLHTQYPLCHFHRRSISICDHRLLFILSSWPPLHICVARQWDTNAETYNTNDSDFDEDFDDSVEQWFDVLEDYIDAIWIFKVFKSYGWTLPFVISSILLTAGPKAFLMALALPLGQSTLTFALQRFPNRDKIEPKLKKKNKKRKSRAFSSRNAKIKETEERIRNKGTRKRKKVYHSWISKNDVSVRSSDGSNFGGWDELDERIEPNVGFSTRADPNSNELRGSHVEKGKNGRLSESDGPLLLRLLVSIFPFLSSWTEVL